MVFVCLLGVARAQGASTRRHTKASLVAETDGVQPGRPLTVGIRLQMEPGWHTYWRNPGDSGLPTRVKWTLPPGFEAGELRWPYPISFTTGLLVSYGYAHEVLLPVEIRVPPALGEREVRLVARVDWLECQDACLPGKADVSLTLSVRSSARPGPEAAAFADARDRLPAADPTWRFSAAPAGDAIALVIRPARRPVLADAYFHAITPRVLDYAKPQALERAKTGYRLVLARDPNGAPADRLAGVLVVEAGGRRRAIAVDVKVNSR
jgi:thiol:disulfide interchange protein DsbD